MQKNAQNYKTENYLLIKAKVFERLRNDTASTQIPSPSLPGG
jgi:hypothetical protein